MGVESVNVKRDSPEKRLHDEKIHGEDKSATRDSIRAKPGQKEQNVNTSRAVGTLNKS